MDFSRKTAATHSEQKAFTRFHPMTSVAPPLLDWTVAGPRPDMMTTPTRDDARNFEDAPAVARRCREASGFSLLELILITGLMGVIMAIAVPMSGNALGFFRLSGDARSASNSIALAKMRASSAFSRARVFVDLSSNSYHLETWDKTSSTWKAEGTNNVLSSRVAFGYGSVSAAPPNTQATIGQSPLCKDNTGADISNTACVIFNTRGVPVDSTGAPIVDALYLTDGSAVYGVTVSASGMVRMWRTPRTSTPAWVLQ
jgi:Tfp pilus assembly protein FimT